MKLTTLGICVLATAAFLSACGASATPTPTPAPTPSPVSTSLAAIAPGQKAAPTLLDPCQLVPIPEASSLAGTSFGAGQEDTTPGGGKICTYGSQTTNVFMVEVAQAKDVATAQADKAQFLSDLQSKVQELSSKGLNVTQLPNFADGAVLATASLNVAGKTINGSAIGILKGTVFFGFSDIVVGQAAPTSDALQSEATTVLGRLP